MGRDCLVRLSILSACLAAICAGCSQPSAPSPAPPSLYLLSGVVSEMTSAGPVAVAGIRVEDSSAGVSTSTDVNGEYRLTLAPGQRTVLATGGPFVRNVSVVTISRDTRVDIRLIRTGPFTMSGRVFEETADGHVPIEDVEVYCDSCGPFGHTFVDTDRDGVFRFFDVTAGSNPIFVRKAGYRLLDQVDQFGRKAVVVTYDVQLDVRMERQ